MADKHNFTKKYIESLQAQEKEYVVWDISITGFGCKISPTGRKTYIYMYRKVTKKKIKLTIGKHGPLTLEMARNKVKNIISSINDGSDPHEEKKKQKDHIKQQVLFRDFWKIYEERHILQKNKPSTLHKGRARIKYLLDYFGDKAIESIRRQDLIDFEKYLISRKVGKSVFTKTWKELLSPAFNHAEIWGYREENTNPCKKLSTYKSKRIQNCLTDLELEKLENVLATLDCQSVYSKSAILMAVYTGIRMGQLLRIKWSDIDFDKKIIFFRDTKTGESALPINPSAYTLLKTISRVENNPYVFCGKSPGTHLISIDSLWKKVRVLAGIPTKRLHDLRHSFASFALKKGVDLYTVSKLLDNVVTRIVFR